MNFSFLTFSLEIDFLQNDNSKLKKEKKKVFSEDEIRMERKIWKNVIILLNGNSCWF